MKEWFYFWNIFPASTYTMETILIRKQTYQLLMKTVDGKSNKTCCYLLLCLHFKNIINKKRRKIIWVRQFYTKHSERNLNAQCLQLTGEQKKNSSSIISTWHNCFNSLQPGMLIYVPWKHQKSWTFSDVFRGYRLATSGCNGLTVKSV